MSSLDVDPNANPIVRANARLVVWWTEKNEAWSKLEQKRHALKWILWEFTWPLLLLSQALLMIYSLITAVALKPIDMVW